MIDLLLTLIDLSGIYKVSYIVRYGTNDEDTNEVVVVGCDERGNRMVKGVKMASARLGELTPYQKYNILGERDHLTKLLFLRYLDSHPDERFFQSVRNFSMLHFGEFRFIGHSADGENYKDTFYIETDDILNIGEPEKKEADGEQ